MNTSYGPQPSDDDWFAEFSRRVVAAMECTHPPLFLAEITVLSDDYARVLCMSCGRSFEIKDV
jgi:hypothetical protein